MQFVLRAINRNFLVKISTSVIRTPSSTLSHGMRFSKFAGIIYFGLPNLCKFLSPCFISNFNANKWVNFSCVITHSGLIMLSFNRSAWLTKWLPMCSRTDEILSTTVKIGITTKNSRYGLEHCSLYAMYRILTFWEPCQWYFRLGMKQILNYEWNIFI